MSVEHSYRDSPLILAQRELTRAAALVGRLLEQADPKVTMDLADSPDSQRREALQELVPRWHFGMLNDLNRNSLFQEAIENAVRPGDHVLDIGSGSGLLAMIAARSGAAHVTSCELVRPIAQAAERIVADNGLESIIRIVNKRSDELIIGIDLPRRADIIVTEIVDCGLFGEGLMPAIRLARENLLTATGTIIPYRATLMAAPIDSASIWQLNQVSQACGFDVSHFNEFATAGYFQVRLRIWPHVMLAEPRAILSFDLLADPLESEENYVEIAVQRSGVCHGIAFWFELGLDHLRTLSNDPINLTSHWQQAFQCFPQPLSVSAGEPLRLKVANSDESVHFTPVA